MIVRNVPRETCEALVLPYGGLAYTYHFWRRGSTCEMYDDYCLRPGSCGRGCRHKVHAYSMVPPRMAYYTKSRKHLERSGGSRGSILS